MVLITKCWERSEKLKSHPSLICLDLSRNPITKKGIEY